MANYDRVRPQICPFEGLALTYRIPFKQPSAAIHHTYKSVLHKEEEEESVDIAWAKISKMDVGFLLPFPLRTLSTHCFIDEIWHMGIGMSVAGWDYCHIYHQNNLRNYSRFAIYLMWRRKNSTWVLNRKKIICFVNLSKRQSRNFAIHSWSAEHYWKCRWDNSREDACNMAHLSHGSFPLPLSLTLIHIEDIVSSFVGCGDDSVLVPVTLRSLVACPLFMCGLERFQTSEYLEEQVTARVMR